MKNTICTQKIEDMRQYTTDEILCGLIGISKPTLYTRLKKSNWTKGEISLILNMAR